MPGVNNKAMAVAKAARDQEAYEMPQGEEHENKTITRSFVNIDQESFISSGKWYTSRPNRNLDFLRIGRLDTPTVTLMSRKKRNELYMAQVKAAQPTSSVEKEEDKVQRWHLLYTNLLSENCTFTHNEECYEEAGGD